MPRSIKVGPPRRPAAHLYTIPELDDLQHQLKLKGCTRIHRMEQLALVSQEPGIKPTQILFWRDSAGMDWVAYAR